MKTFVLGIDPGKQGGIVGTTNGKINLLDHMPQGPDALWDYFETSGLRLILQSQEINTNVFIEDVHSMPTDGTKSAFSFGRQLGWLDMLITRFPVRITRVTPSRWMDVFEIRRSKEESRYNFKKRILANAKMVAPVLYRDRLDLYTADAYYIARYGEAICKGDSKKI